MHTIEKLTEISRAGGKALSQSQGTMVDEELHKFIDRMDQIEVINDQDDLWKEYCKFFNVLERQIPQRITFDNHQEAYRILHALTVSTETVRQYLAEVLCFPPHLQFNFFKSFERQSFWKADAAMLKEIHRIGNETAQKLRNGNMATCSDLDQKGYEKMFNTSTDRFQIVIPKKDLYGFYSGRITTHPSKPTHGTKKFGGEEFSILESPQQEFHIERIGVADNSHGTKQKVAAIMAAGFLSDSAMREMPVRLKFR